MDDARIRILSLGGTWETLGSDRLRGIVPTGIEASSDSWGPSEMHFALAAEAGARRPDILPFTPVELEVGGILIWSGFVWQRPSDQNSYSVGCRGWQFCLDDDLWTWSYVHTRLADYADNRSLLSTNLATATQAGTINGDNGIITLGFPNGSVLAAGMYVGVTYDAGPDASFIRAVLSAESSFNAASTFMYVMGHNAPNWDGAGAATRLDYVSGQAINAAPWTAASQAQTFSGTIAGGRRYTTIMLYISPGYTAAADVWIKIRSCQLFSDAALESGGVSTLKASRVVGDSLQFAPLLSQSQSLITAGTFSIPSFSIEGYQTSRQVMEAANLVENYRLKLGGETLKQLVYDAKPSSPIAEVGDWSGSQFDDATVTGEPIYNRAILDGTGPDGARLVSKRTQAGDLVTRRGFTRSARVDVSSAVTSAVADRINDLWLTEHKTAPFSGTLRLIGGGARRPQSSQSIPPQEFLLYSGEKIRLANRVDPDTGNWGRDGRIAGSTYRHDGCAVEISISDQRTRLDTVLARYAALVGG